MFSDKLKELRNAQKMTQSTFAKEFHVATSTVAMWETGKREPDFDVTSRLANYFNVSTDYLLGRDEQKEIRPSVDERILKLSNQYEEAGKLFDLFDKLSPEQQNTILSLAQVYIAQQEKDNTK